MELQQQIQVQLHTASSCSRPKVQTGSATGLAQPLDQLLDQLLDWLSYLLDELLDELLDQLLDQLLESVQPGKSGYSVGPIPAGAPAGL